MVERLSEPWGAMSRRHRAGDVAGGCRLEKLLHDDGVCEVFRATDEQDGHSCLVKCFGRRVTEYDEEVVAQAMEHEQKLAANVNLGMVLSAVQEENILDSVVVCAWHDGSSLANILRNEGVFDEKRCLDIAKAIASELEHFELAGLAHGSLTLEGVRLDYDGQVWLGSCGFPGMTGRYACQDARNGDFDVVSDFYSVGVMIYEMLSGESPFGGGGQVIPLWERRPDVSSDICLLVHRLLSEKRDVRPPSVQELMDGLSAIDLSSRLSGESLAARVKKMEENVPSKSVKMIKGVSAALRSRPEKTGSSWFLKIVAAVLILLSFGVGYGWANSSQGSLRMPKSLAFLEPALKKIVHGREDVVESQEAIETVESQPSEVVDNVDIAADEKGKEEEELQEEEVAPQDVENGKVVVVSSQREKEALVEEEPMARWTQMEDGNPAADENDNVVAGGKDPEKELNAEDATTLQKQLETALKKRNAKEIKDLMNAGAKLDWVSEDGTSLLQQACARGHWDAVEFMLKQGANPNWRPKSPGEKFKLPLQIALDNGKKTYPALLMLLKYKADPQILFDTALYFTGSGDEIGKTPVGRNIAGIVALSQYGYIRENRAFQIEALTTWLSAQKGSLSDEVVANVLKSAIEQKMSKGFIREIMQRIKTMKSPEYGPVLLAAMKHKNRIELLGMLKDRGIQVNNVCELEKDGVLIEETPLYYAVRTKCEEPVIRWLLANGASVKWTDADGKTVMDLDTDPKIKQLLLNVKQGKKITQEWSGSLYTTGTTTIKTNMPWEADLNGRTVKGEHEDWVTTQPSPTDKQFEGDIDFFWRYEMEQKMLTLEPRNGCEVLVMTGNLTPFDQIEVSYIAKQKFSEKTLSYSKEEGSPLRAGSIILFRTSRGNFGKFRVVRYEDEIIDKKKRRNVSLMIHWVVYHLQEEEVRQSHSKRTIW
ncbi:MAG: hypothetical protein IKZ46_06015 [Victivallales bacterium]|nr:hypothetical protein [Victivallales bacterium]